MDNYKVKLVKNNLQIDITNIIGNLSWSNSINSLGTKLSFDTARNPKDKYLNVFDSVEVGSFIVLTNNNNEIFRGIVVTEDIEQYKKAFSCLDFAFYLNQNKIIKQFKAISVSNAITQLCNSYSIPIGKVCNIATLITNIYNEKSLAEIIKDMLNKATAETGLKYRLEMRKGKLFVEKYTDLVVQAKVQLAKNIASFNSLQAIASLKRSRSIIDMKNSIVVYSASESYNSVEATAKDTANMQQFGLLQDTIKVENKDIAQARNIASKKLAELSKIITSTNIEILGNDELNAGRILHLNLASYDINGDFLIKDCKHTYNNGLHKCSLSLEEL
ncbi:hypothetical protein IMX26_07540 [Clostridium sp. 'deep sea']|uniref:XkdQ/YqbQ family protein n=1 Tax=Clostridium sp. 'deep sea' TaxID=2779445 RepID=UPI0018966CE4|nr:hypothetical protein [Clostridium sp. 'deep sea']QOR36649.1 hypothetical protein IMX26_07540 [Clostridium sp. 'deep sea']